MIALGFGVIWIGYAVGFTGYAWVRGYNLSFTEIVSPTKFYTGQWKPGVGPGLVNDATVLIPTGSNTGGGSTAGQSDPTQGGTEPVKAKNKICPPGFIYDSGTGRCLRVPHGGG